MTTEEALVELADSTARAVKDVLATFCGDGVEIEGISIVPRGTDPLETMPAPAVVSNVSYVGGVAGGNVFVITCGGARKLAAAMMGAEPDEGDAELSDLELSAVGEAANQMFATAAAATGGVLGQDVEIEPPETHLAPALAGALDAYQATPHMTNASFKVGGEACRLIQLIPQAFVVRMGMALDEQAAVAYTDVATGADAPGMPSDWLHCTPLRLSAELGRTRMPIGAALGLADGAIVPLDRRASDPIDLYLNGTAFGRGRLLRVEEGEWALRIETLYDPSLESR